jgi:heptaprenyl diphosphate synthase
MNNKTKKIALTGVLISVALVLSYLEVLLPPLYPTIPGIKVGLPNIVVIIALYKYGFKEACIISVIRVCIVSLLFGNAMTFAYSIAGALISILLMTLFKKLSVFSEVGVSIIGGIAHNIGQIIVAIILLNSTLIGYYMIVLTITGTLAGAFIGVAGSLLCKRLKNIG